MEETKPQGPSDKLSISLVSHASLLFRTSDGSIWTDPWLQGRAFNDSWSLLGGSIIEPEQLQLVRWIWISHEHPDHFHVQTLRSLPAHLKDQVTVLYQRNNSIKMSQAVRKLGFNRFESLPHNRIVRLDENVEVLCYQVGQMDSVLYVRSNGQSVINVNDAELNQRDCRRIVDSVGRPDVVLNQFSMAGYSGLPERDRHLPEMAKRVLLNVQQNHVDLGAKVTVPIASFVYFCTSDNAYMNGYVNSPRRVLEWMENAGLSAKVLAPGEQWTVDDPVENRESVSYWDDVFGNIGSLPTFDSVVVPLEKVRDEFFARSKDLRTKFPRTLLRMAGPIVIAVEDLDTILCLDFARGHLAVVDQDPDVSIQSQPLHFMLANPYGLQTLGVSARYTLHNATRKWKVLRIVMALDNAELYLRLRYLFSVKLWRHIYARRHGAWGQVRYQLQRMLPNT